MADKLKKLKRVAQSISFMIDGFIGGGVKEAGGTRVSLFTSDVLEEAAVDVDGH